jgi:hypothetical protein
MDKHLFTLVVSNRLCTLALGFVFDLNFTIAILSSVTEGHWMYLPSMQTETFHVVRCGQNITKG